MAPPQSREHLATIADISHSPEITLGDRLAASRDSLRVFRAYPLLGVGLGGFETVFPRYQTFVSDLTWEHAHNDYAEALAETGAVGGVLILCALGFFFTKAFSRRGSALSPTSRVPSTRRLAPGTLLRLGAALGCCGLLVHSFVDFNLHIPANAAWFAVCAALSTCDVLRAANGHHRLRGID
jgi:O-antigen ligase